MYMYGMDEELELEEEDDQQIDTMSDGIHPGSQQLSYDDDQSDIQEIHPDFEDDNEVDVSEQFESDFDEEEVDFIDQGRISNLSEVKVFIDEVICPICCHILVNPKTCRECDQAFCTRCIEKWFEKHNRQVCPCCRSSNLSSYQYHNSSIMSGKIPKILLNLLSKLLLTCRHRNDGCEEVVTYEFREKHETLYCLYQIVECENLGCQERMIKKEMEEHILECEYGKVHCKYCTKDYFRRDIENHVFIWFNQLQYCDYRPVMCQWCKIKHQFVDLQKHSEECEFRKVSCEYCKKEFKFFEMKEHTPINCQVQTAEKYKILYEKEKEESKIKDQKILQKDLRIAQQEERIECQSEIIKDLKHQLELMKQQRRTEQSDENQSTQELSNQQYDEDFEDDDEEIEEDIQIDESEQEQLETQQPLKQIEKSQENIQSETQDYTNEPSILEIKMRGLYTSLLTRLNDNNFKELWDWSEEDINQVLGWYK